MNFYYLDYYVEPLTQHRSHSKKLDKLIVVANNIGQAEVKMNKLICKLDQKHQSGKVKPVGRVKQIEGFIVGHDFFGQADVVCLSEDE